jgi:protein gp37
MSDKSAIAWTDATLNPTTGCQQVSPGCDACYARTLVNTRLSKNPKSIRFGTAFEQVMLHPERLATVLQWKRPRRIFMNSLSDLFHKDVPDDFIAKVFVTMVQADWHTFQVLTKRPERMRRWVAKWYQDQGIRPAMNIQLGVSIENADYAWRADMLRETPAAVRVISFEPLLGSVANVSLSEVSWAICGGESGRDYRPMKIAWAQEVHDRCRAEGVAFFMKQDSGIKAGQRGRIPDDLWVQQFPVPLVSA